MNSVCDAHANKRVKDFEEQGYKVRLFGFDRNLGNARRADIAILGSFSNNTKYCKRIKIYLKGIKEAFKMASDKDCLWFYQGLDTAMFACIIGRKRKYIYEECDLVHSNINNKLIRYFFEKIDRHIIKNSHRTILTSEGFLKYHYKSTECIPENIIILPNKLSREVTDYAIPVSGKFNSGHIRFSFIGGLRYNSLLSLARYICRNYPNHEFHFYGYISPTITEEDLPKGNNVFYHGSFSSPQDLPEIYSKTDVVVATYDISSPNVRFAEPNKFYEAIYFNCPIIVSKHTFLEEKVKRFKIGYSVNAYDEKEVVELVKAIERNYQQTKNSISEIQKDMAIDNYNITQLI